MDGIARRASTSTLPRRIGRDRWRGGNRDQRRLGAGQVAEVQEPGGICLGPTEARQLGHQQRPPFRRREGRVFGLVSGQVVGGP